MDGRSLSNFRFAADVMLLSNYEAGVVARLAELNETGKSRIARQPEEDTVHGQRLLREGGFQVERSHITEASSYACLGRSLNIKKDKEAKRGEKLTDLSSRQQTITRTPISERTYSARLFSLRISQRWSDVFRRKGGELDSNFVAPT